MITIKMMKKMTMKTQTRRLQLLREQTLTCHLRASG